MPVLSGGLCGALVPWAAVFMRIAEASKMAPGRSELCRGDRPRATLFPGVLQTGEVAAQRRIAAG